ncbi:Oidioi.mRNA.OKI2018_I69.chr1.g3416.t1.cds [Oikopleura dioica]|uniref:Oidioi.mRNA.OKI2018_I69.chr1.g3416.t1.cds n=1 Tax=Oikopleura dioica TaxID=34765 RepID=A0ABN7T0W0_OIKDI|nr:Oidioi.mRNA.OKI2018_I69.chr1.g3416.t1.cds [Oikopleura dioica]
MTKDLTLSISELTYRQVANTDGSISSDSDEEPLSRRARIEKYSVATMIGGFRILVLPVLAQHLPVSSVN